MWESRDQPLPGSFPFGPRKDPGNEVVQKAVLEGTRSGSGKVIKEHWDTLIQIWGGAPGTVSLECGESSLNGLQPEVEDEASQPETIPGIESTTKDHINEPKKRKCPTALYVDEKRKKLEKS